MRKYTHKKTLILQVISNVLLISLLISACASAAPNQATQPPAATQPAATEPAQTRAPAGEVDRKDTLIMGVLGGIGPTPDLQNPFSYSSNVGAGLQQLQIESLFYLNFESGKIEPWLAESYEMSEDDTSMTIKLRKGIEWSDGEPFTSKDVVFTFDLLQKNAPNLWHSEDINEHVKKANAIDDLTVRIDFTRPEPRYIYGLAIAIYNSLPIVPEHIWKDQDPTKFKNFDISKGWPVFTGPYVLVSADQNQLIYDRNDNWWAAKTGFHDLPAPKRVVMVNPGTEESAAASLENNQVDVIPQMGIGTYEAVIAKNPKVITWSKEKPYGWIDTCPDRLAINNMVEPWTDPVMRHALSLAIDKAGYANVTTEGAGIQADWLFPPYPPLQKYIDANKDLLEKYETNKYDPQKALELFASKGYKQGAGGKLVGPDGAPVTLDLLMVTPDSGGVQWGLATTAFTEYLNAVGITVNPQIVDFSVFEPGGRKGDYDIRLMWTCGSVVDPLGTLGNYLDRQVKPIGEESAGNEANTERWSNAEYTKIVDEIATLAPDDPKIDELFRQAFEMWLSEYPAIPLNQKPWIIPFNTTYWTNWPTEENNYIHPPVWWQTELMTILNIKPAQ